MQHTPTTKELSSSFYKKEIFSFQVNRKIADPCNHGHFGRRLGAEEKGREEREGKGREGGEGEEEEELSRIDCTHECLQCRRLLIAEFAEKT